MERKRETLATGTDGDIIFFDRWQRIFTALESSNTTRWTIYSIGLGRIMVSLSSY